MIKEALCEGADVEAALEKAKAALGVTETDEYDFEVVQREEKKRFGIFGGKPAKVRVFINIPDPKPAAKPKAESPAPAPAYSKPAPKAEKKTEKRAERKPDKKPAEKKAAPAPAPATAQAQAQAPAELPDDASVEKTATFLRDVLDHMGLADIAVEKSIEPGAISFELSGEEEGFVIGRRGETLDALQYLTSLVANHSEQDYIKVTVNVGNYRVKREKTLEILGRKLAFKAIKTGKKTSLEPMNPYERRIIHTAVQKVNGAVSWSEGENATRHVVIGPDPKSRHNRRGGYNNNRRGGRGGYNKNRSSNPAPDPNRVPLNEGGATGLYGRIDK